jgi:hypothetical protein
VTRWEQSWAEAVLESFVVDNSSGLNVAGGEVDYLAALGRMRRGGTALAAVGLRAAIWMVALAPLWVFGRCVTFGQLTSRERAELLRRLLSHRVFAVRELTLLLKLTAAMALLGTASVRARTHYDDSAKVVKVQDDPSADSAASARHARALRVLP